MSNGLLAFLVVATAACAITGVYVGAVVCAVVLVCVALFGTRR